MTVKISDVVFVNTAKPTLVIKKEHESDHLTLLSDQKAVAKLHRHGYINGIDKDQRTALNKILDTAKNEKVPLQRMNSIINSVNELKKKPSNYKLVQYLEGEISHIKNSFKIVPNTYKVTQSEIN